MGAGAYAGYEWYLKTYSPRGSRREFTAEIHIAPSELAGKVNPVVCRNLQLWQSFDSFCKMRLLSYFVSEHFMVEIACFALITSYFGKIAKLQS